MGTVTYLWLLKIVCSSKNTMTVLGIIIICLLASHTINGANGVYFEEISATDGNMIIEALMQRTPIIHKSFHQCSITAYCNYVIKNSTTERFSIYNSSADLPLNTTGHRIWKKLYHGKLEANTTASLISLSSIVEQVSKL